MGLTTRQRHAMARASLQTPGGIFEYMVEQASTGEVFEHHVQDVEPILKNNKRLKAEAEAGNGGYSPEGDWKRVASIPLIVVEKWLFEEGIDAFDKNDWPKVAAKLDSPEYLYLRTAPGKVSKRPIREHPTTFGREVKKQKDSDLVVVTA